MLMLCICGYKDELDTDPTLKAFTLFYIFDVPESLSSIMKVTIARLSLPSVWTERSHLLVGLQPHFYYPSVFLINSQFSGLLAFLLGFLNQTQQY